MTFHSSNKSDKQVSGSGGSHEPASEQEKFLAKLRETLHFDFGKSISNVDKTQTSSNATVNKILDGFTIDEGTKT